MISTGINLNTKDFFSSIDILCENKTGKIERDRFGYTNGTVYLPTRVIKPGGENILQVMHLETINRIMVQLTKGNRMVKHLIKIRI